MTGSEVKKRRLALGLSQWDLYRISGFMPSAISRWETKNVEMMRANAEKLDRILKELEAKAKVKVK